MCSKLVGAVATTLGSEVELCRMVLDRFVDGERMVLQPVIAKLIAITIAITGAHHKRGKG